MNLRKIDIVDGSTLKNLPVRNEVEVLCNYHKWRFLALSILLPMANFLDTIDTNKIIKKDIHFFLFFLPSHRVVIHHLRILGRIDRQLVPPVYAISNICNRWHFWLQLSFNSPGSVSTQS